MCFEYKPAQTAIEKIVLLDETGRARNSDYAAVHQQNSVVYDPRAKGPEEEEDDPDEVKPAISGLGITEFSGRVGLRHGII